MPKYNNVTFQTQEKLPDTTEKNITALTFFRSHWGPINVPILVEKEQLKKRFGNYDADTEDEWLQAYNFGTYSDNLEIFRVSNLSSTPTFDGSTELLTSVSGSSHSHLFINSADQIVLNTVWHESNNGSELIVDLNDEDVPINLPSFASNQIMMIYGKYMGDEGNNIGISIASYLDDIKSEYILKKYYEVTVADASVFAVDDPVNGKTSGAQGTIKRIVGNKLYVDVTFKTFQSSEIIYSTNSTITRVNGTTISVEDSSDFTASETITGKTSGATATIDSIYLNELSISGITGTFVAGEVIYNYSSTITSIIDKDDVNYNETFFDKIRRNLQINEFCLVVTHENQIKETHIISLNVEDHNYITNLKSEYIKIVLDDSYVPATSTDSLATKQSKTPALIYNDKLLFGNTGISDLSASAIASQLDLLKDENVTNMILLFSENEDQTIQNKVKEIVDERNDCFSLLNYYSDPIRDYETLFNSKNVAVFRNYKKQNNIFENYISTYGILGDVAGKIIAELNDVNFDNIVGARNSLKNILSVNEYSISERDELFTQSYNIISRNRETFYINGNYTTSADKNKTDSSMIIRLMILYIIKRINTFLDNQIGEDLNADFENDIVREMEDLKEKISKFMRSFEYDYEIDYDNNLLILNLYSAPNDLMDKIEITINEIV